MLELLHIENIAIIERADILFGRGFNALTGETGAGKSIVIDALGAVLGQRTSRELIRTGAEKAFVSATFSAVPADLPGLAENGFTPEEDGTLLLQRELYGDGKNVCRVGGRPVTVAQLKRIGASLLNIHGQHDGQQLLDEEQHLVYLDRFGRVENELEAYRARYDVMKGTRRAIDALKMDKAEKARRVDMLHHQIGELERAGIGLVVHVTCEHDLSAERFGALHLDIGGRCGHDDGGGHAVALCRVGHSLRVVAGRRGDETALALVV